MFTETAVSLTYDGSFEGFLSCVFDCYYLHFAPLEIVATTECTQTSLFEQIFITTNPEKAARVYKSLLTKISPIAQSLVEYGFLAASPKNCSTEMLLYNFIKKAFSLGKGILANYQIPEYVLLDKSVTGLKKEAHLMTGFLRFSLMGDFLFAKIGPKNNVLPLIAPHFANRFASEHFIIYDETRDLAMIYKPSEYIITDVALQPFQASLLANVAPNLITSSSQSENHYQRLWQAFYQAIAIESRFNPKCRMNHMPKRFWTNLTEFQT
ncbi:MAG: TIGR03915 family putative DNA repair protein [Clostridia bacterium]